MIAAFASRRDVSSALSRRQAIRLSVSRCAYATTGANFTSIGIGYVTIISLEELLAKLLQVIF